jgi:hypothetical protein
MKNHSPSNGENGQLVQSQGLVHSIPQNINISNSSYPFDLLLEDQGIPYTMHFLKSNPTPTQLHIVKDVVKHHFIHLSRHSSVHSFGHPSVSSWSVYSDGAGKEWNTDATQRRIIYISVVNLFLFLIFTLGFLDLGTLILSLSQQLKGWVGLFFFFFF